MGLELLKRPALPLPSITFVMRHLSVTAAAILALAALATLPPLTDARLVPKCELYADLLFPRGSQERRMSRDIVAKVICFVSKTSGFNTNAVTPVHGPGEKRPKPQSDFNEMPVVEERQGHGRRAKRSREDSDSRDNSESSGMESEDKDQMFNGFQPNRRDRERGPPSKQGDKENRRRQKRSMPSSEEGDASGMGSEENHHMPNKFKPDKGDHKYERSRQQQGGRRINKRSVQSSEEGDASGMGSPEKHEDASKGQKAKPGKGFKDERRRKRPRRSISSEDVMESSGMPPEDHSVQTPRLLGIFQINSQLACGNGKPEGICHLKCEQLLDDNIQDDITCLKIIHEKWPEMMSTPECRTASWSSLLSECK
ncbi:protein FAM133-like [Polypterus senegalus]|uniref:protein FAM133-like n=1 Tax=Polypterus senegalus TaxID=55291 RepID=UPI001964FCCF|nr:protein FAM133-like [Polypterus senegalus]